MRRKTIMIKMVAIIWILPIMSLSACSEPNNSEDDIQVSKDAIYDLIYEKMYNDITCVPRLNKDVELTEVYMNDKMISFPGSERQGYIGDIPDDSFSLRIVSYDINGNIISEVKYNNVLCFDAEYNEVLGYIPEDTEYLFVYNTRYLNDIKSIENLKELRGLSITYGKCLKDISPIEKLTNLEVIDLHDNEVIYDISALRNLTKVKMLRISGNKITDISPLENLVELRYLDIYVNQIVNISALSNLTKLGWINISGNMIANVKPLSKLENLEYLNIGRNNVTDYSSLDEAGIEYD